MCGTREIQSSRFLFPGVIVKPPSPAAVENGADCPFGHTMRSIVISDH
jgi:hypothetical protein